MAKVLQKQNQVILWTGDYLFLEWKIEISDAEKCDIFRSSLFKLDGKKESIFEIWWQKKEDFSYLYLLNVDCLRSRNARIRISDSNKLVICDVDAYTDDLYIANTNCLKINLHTPSSENFPLTITGTVINSNIIPHYRRPESTEKHATTDESYSTDSMTGLTELSVDFKKILDSSIYADIILKVEDVSIKAHKIVLYARSTVFQKMLSHNATETAENTISISDISAATMKKFIAYLYTGNKGKCSFEECCELYYAADKYEVLSLRDACRLELLTHLEVDNACTLLSLTSRHSDEIFVEEVVQFINANFKSVVETKSFDGLSKDNLKLLMCSHARMMSK